MREWPANKGTKNTVLLMTAVSQSAGTLTNKPSCARMWYVHIFSALLEYFCFQPQN